MENDNASIVGLTYIIDCRDVGVELMMQFDPFLLKKCYTAAEYCMPLKLNEVHVINMRGEGVSVFKFISSFMPSSLSFKFTAHKRPKTSWNTYHAMRLRLNMVAAMVLCHRGHKNVRSEIVKYKDHFKVDSSYAQMKSYASVIGGRNANGRIEWCQGSFRKLELD
ncbi:unnamed protein product [Ceratitis capitata]|uniref:(Mediterranean fruit fly) hypothetical protein n=1 Tax=Ceratitis capitata TaxID=7213 RepID=A0A811U1Q3_CERCA|nr:unnamed protein product [Ceratitis capitata]